MAQSDAVSLLECLEARQLLSVATFGPETLTPRRAADAVVVDLDDDGVLDRVSAQGRRLAFEKGLGDGAYGTPLVLTLGGQAGSLVGGRFRGAAGGWLVASVAEYRDEGASTALPALGYVVRVIDSGAFTGVGGVVARAFVPLTGTARRIASTTLIAGDLLGDANDELILGINLVTPGDPDGATRGRVMAQSFQMPSSDRIGAVRTLMDRSFTAPRARFDGVRVQAADLNGDGRLDALVRPVTSWRAELGPVNSTGAASLVTTARQIPGSDEAAAGGRFLFADVTGDGLADRVLVRTLSTAGAQGPGSVATVSVSVGVETGIVNFQYLSRVNQPTQQVFSFGDVAGLGGTLRPTAAVVGQLVVRDLNNDGLADLLVTGNATRTLIGGTQARERSFAAALLRSNAGVFTSRGDLGVVETVRLAGFRLGDVDGDGLPDLLGVGAATDRGVSVFVNNSDAID